MIHMTTLYFSKMNLNSHIYEVYDAEDKKGKLNEILKDIYNSIKDNVFYEDNILGVDDEGNAHSKIITYKLVQLDSMIAVEDLAIVGRMVKTSTLITNKLEEDGTISKIPVINDEVVEFYFDVSREIVAYNRTNRFGHKDINDAFEKILNKLFEDEILSNTEQEFPYYVKFENVREGLSLDNLKRELFALGKVKELTLEIIPPNPDDDLLDRLNEEADNYLNDLKSAKVTHRKLTLTSRDPDGLQLNEELVEGEINKINEIHSELSSEEALENGYVSVQAYSQNGISFSTRKSKVRTAIIEETSSLISFAQRCKDKIRRIKTRNQNEEGS